MDLIDYRCAHAEIIAQAGWSFSPSTATWSAINPIDPRAWSVFRESWHSLLPDRYMADSGRYRRRRHAALILADGKLTQLPPQPHFQSRDHNPLNGGIQRKFAQIKQTVLENSVFAALAKLWIDIFELQTSIGLIEVHQFRIEAGETSGRPTPEGMHRDGVDHVGVFLIDRYNVAAGTTLIEVNDEQGFREFTLTNALDAVFVDDHRVRHGVTPICRIDPTQEAWRDVLVLTFARQSM